MDSLIDTINKLQDVFNTLGQDSIDLPQIVVVGSQSSGKSSVLENLVGFDFLPRGNGIVTRRPLVLQLINIPASSQDPEAISEYAQFLHCPSKKFVDMSEVKAEIIAETERLAGNNKGIVRTPIHLKIFSPKVLNLTLVDLPGLTKIPVGDQPTDIDIQIKSLVMEYISKPNSIILAISPANVDLANSESLKIAREVDPEHKRTLGVLTKLDLMDKGTSAVEVLTGCVYPLRLGFIGIVARNQEETSSNSPISKALADENSFFDNHPLYRTIRPQCGSSNLGKSLNSLLIYHIKERIPEIKTKVDSLISSTEYELESFGQINESPQKNNLARLLKLVTQFATNFNNAVEGTWVDLPTNQLSGGARLYYIFHQIFAAGLEKINPVVNLSNSDIRTAIRNSSGPRGSLFVPELSFQLLIKPLIKSLEAPSQRCVQLAYEELLQIGNYCDSNELRRFPKLHQKVISVVSKLLRERVLPTSEYVESIIAVERAYINTNHPDFIGGTGALEELNRKAEIKRREATKIMLRASNKFNPNNKNHPESNIDSDTSHDYNDNYPNSLNHLENISNKSQRYNDNQDPNYGKSPVSEQSVTQNFSKQLNINDNFEFNQSSTNESNVFYKSFFGNASEKIFGKGGNDPYNRTRDNQRYEMSSYTNDNRLNSSQIEIPLANNIDDLEITLIRLLISSYFNIVKKSVMDLVPKTIMHYLVNQTCENLQNRLVEELYAEGSADELMQEDPALLSEYNKCKSTLEIYQRCYSIISEIV
ncbi:hypothetical protein BB561_001487 [Smittium simulii]|uniref:Dynamin GTPase n=1 Tax=Smittium simulii TaxID=133385 RepID=A0A2T9YUK2_9FUNG|nr:hypothetical protein BB561_001487 [Smittium simulii]